MIYIDFYPGAHGHFLKFLINRFILQLGTHCEFDPFDNTFGPTHQLPSNSNTLTVLASGFSCVNNRLTLPDLSCLIELHVDADVKYPVLYNQAVQLMPGNSQEFLIAPADLKTLNVNTLVKLKNHKDLSRHIQNDLGLRTNYPRYWFRNIFYNKITVDQYFLNKANKFNFSNSTECLIKINVSSLYNLELLTSELIKISNLLDKIPNFENLDSVWETFMSVNWGYQSKIKCDTIYNQIINKQTADIDLDVLEEAYLDSLLGHGPYEDDDYPTNTSKFYQNNLL